MGLRQAFVGSHSFLSYFEWIFEASQYLRRLKYYGFVSKLHATCDVVGAISNERAFIVQRY